MTDITTPAASRCWYDAWALEYILYASTIASTNATHNPEHTYPPLHDPWYASATTLDAMTATYLASSIVATPTPLISKLKQLPVL